VRETIEQVRAEAQPLKYILDYAVPVVSKAVQPMITDNIVKGLADFLPRIK